MVHLPSTRIIPRLIAGLALVFGLSCALVQTAVSDASTRPTQAVYLPQAIAPAAPSPLPAGTPSIPKPPAPVKLPELVEVTRLVPGPAVEVTRLVPGPTQEVTRLVEVLVTQVVIETLIVERPVTLAPTNTSEAPTATPTLPVLSQTMLVHYDFEGSFVATNRVVDRSGSDYHAVPSGVVSAVDGVAGGQAIAFDGSSYILTRGNPAAGLTTASFSLWFKTERPNDDFKLASAAWWSAGPGSGWLLGTNFPDLWGDDNDSLFRSNRQTLDLPVPAGRWTHYALVYDGERIREYLDGGLVSDLGARAAGIGSGRDMAVGGWPQYTGFNFVGSIDEFRLYGRALTGADILTLYNQRQ